MQRCPNPGRGDRSQPSLGIREDRDAASQVRVSPAPEPQPAWLHPPPTQTPRHWFADLQTPQFPHGDGEDSTGGVSPGRATAGAPGIAHPEQRGQAEREGGEAPTQHPGKPLPKDGTPDDHGPGPAGPGPESHTSQRTMATHIPMDQERNPAHPDGSTLMHRLGQGPCVC